MSEILARQAASVALAAAAATTTATDAGTPIGCPTDNGYDGNFGARVSAIFVILIGASLGETCCTAQMSLHDD